MCLPPIRHDTSLLSAIGAMASRSTCVTLASRSFNPEEVLKFHEAVADALVVGITDEHLGPINYSSRAAQPRLQAR